MWAPIAGQLRRVSRGMPVPALGRWTGARTSSSAVSPWSKRDLAEVVVGCYALFALVVFSTGTYLARIAGTGDNPDYAREAAALAGRGSAAGGAVHFIGYPALAAPVASALHVSDMYALAVVSIISSLAAIVLAGELWGPWTAACFAVSNLDWVQRSLLGGADPVFAAFIFAALLTARKAQYVPSAVLGSLATTVRPLGIICLLALGFVMLYRREFRSLVVAVAIALATGTLYLLAVGLSFGNSVQNFQWYGSMGLGWQRTFVPFVTVFLETSSHPLTGKNVVKTLVWTTFTLTAVVATFLRPRNRTSMVDAPVEWLFGGLYFLSFLCFPAWWIDTEYPRYFAPVIPLCFFALRGFIPSSRWCVWCVGVFVAVLAAVEDLPAVTQLVRSAAL